MLLTPWLASLLLQKKFYDSWPIIPILILAFLFNVFAGFYGTVFTASMKTRHLMTSTAAAAIVVIVLAVICIFKFPWVMPAVIFSIYLLYGLVRPWVARRWRNRLEARDGE